MELNRRFTPIHMLLLSINGMIGSAWLFAPLYAAKIAGSAAIIAWILGGAATVLIALTFAELSTLLPIAGGTTRFSQLSHGGVTSFMISWASWLSSVTMPPIEVQAVLQYSSTFFPSLTHLHNGAPVLTAIGLFFAACIMLFLVIINIASFKGLIGFNFLLFSFKIIVILLTIGFFVKTSFQTQNFHMGAQNFWNWQAILTAVASGGVAFAFTGFKHGVELAGETRNSQVAVPLGIVGSVVCCLLLYLGLQIAFIGALPASVLSHGWTHLTFNVDVAPFMGIAMLLGLALLAKLLYIDAAVSPLGAGLVYVTSTARLIYAMSKNGYLPAFLSRLNKEDFPIFAIGFNFLVGMGLFLPLPGWQNMVSFLVSAVVIAYAMGPIALMSLRAQLPNEHRPFRLWCAPVTSLIAFYFCNLISYWTGWETIEKLAIAMAVGFLLFSLSIVRQWHDHFRFNWKALIWIMPYLAGLILISYCGSFGGKGYLTFGWDFLVIAIFSVIIFYLAYLTRLRDSQAEFQNYKNTEFAP